MSEDIEDITPIGGRIQPEPTAEYRSATMNTMLGLAAANVVAPFVAPYVHDGIDKLTGPKNDGPQVIIPSGTVKPPKDDG